MRHRRPANCVPRSCASCRTIACHLLCGLGSHPRSHSDPAPIPPPIPLRSRSNPTPDPTPIPLRFHPRSHSDPTRNSDSNVELDKGWIERPGAAPPTRERSYHPPAAVHASPAAAADDGVDAPANVAANVAADGAILCATPSHPAQARPVAGPQLAALVRQVCWQPRHPARSADLSLLVAALRVEVSAGCATVAEDGSAYSPLCIYHYRDQVPQGLGWTEPLLLARGLVLREPRRGGHPCVVATPFAKFFDLGGDGIGLEELCAGAVAWEATEKLDGSLLLLFHDGGRWRVTTKRAWSSEQASWSEQWLRERGVDFGQLRPGTTYVCEAVFASNWVVTRYPPEREGVVLCAAIDASGAELPRTALEAAATASCLPLVPLFGAWVAVGGGTDAAAAAAHAEEGEARLRALVTDAAAYDGRRCEGLILRVAFADGGCHRAKLKSAHYKQLFRQQDSLTPKTVWTAARGGAAALAALESSVPLEFAAFHAAARAAVLGGVAAALAEAHEAVAKAAHAGATDGRGLAALLAAETCWPDGMSITKVQRKLAQRALAGRLGAAVRAGDGETRVVEAIDSLDGAAAVQLFSCVDVPTSVVGEHGTDCICTAGGVRLLNHRRA